METDDMLELLMCAYASIMQLTKKACNIRARLDSEYDGLVHHTF